MAIPDPRGPLRLFAVSAACLAGFGLMLPLAVDGFVSFRHNPPLLAALHLFTLGITALEMGAMYQLTAVLFRRPPVDPQVATGQAILLGLGAALIAGGFALWYPMIVVAGGLLVTAAAGWFAAVMLPRLTVALAEGLTPAYLMGAVISLVLLAILGTTLALNLSFGFLPAGALPHLGAHLALGAGGWFGLAIIGLSYRLVSLFYGLPRGRAPAWAVGMAWLSLAALGALAAGLTFGWAPGVAPLLTAVAALGLIYGADFAVRLLRRRNRRVDVTLVHLFAAVASVTLACAILVAVGVGWAPGSAVWVTVGCLLLPGWAGNMVLGLAYRIISFLSWKQRFSPTVVPSYKRLMPRAIPWVSVGLYNTGVYGVAVATLTGRTTWHLALALALGVGILSFAASVAWMRWGGVRQEGSGAGTLPFP